MAALNFKSISNILTLHSSLLTTAGFGGSPWEAVCSCGSLCRQKFLLLPWVPVCTRPCVYPPSPVELLFMMPDPGLGSLTCGSELSLLWENLCDKIIFKFGGCPPGRYGFGISLKCPSYGLVVYSLSLNVEYPFFG